VEEVGFEMYREQRAKESVAATTGTPWSEATKEAEGRGESAARERGTSHAERGGMSTLETTEREAIDGGGILASFLGWSKGRGGAETRFVRPSWRRRSC
jgi:hypothetical protein